MKSEEWTTSFFDRGGNRSAPASGPVVALAVVLAALEFASGPLDASGASKEIDDLFTNDRVWQIQIEISSQGMATLRQYEWSREARPSDRIAVPATVREGALVYSNVAVHLKGAAGSFRPVDDKPGFTLNFDKLARGQRFHGLEKISLNNSVQDPSYITDQLCREIFAKAGVPAPRASHAAVKLNGHALGLYVLTEGWNKQFLKRNFNNVQGNLYDCGFARDITSRLVVNAGEHPEDQSDLRALVAAAREPDLTNRLARLERTLDLERFITSIALDALLWNWDGYALNRNNYRLFHDLDSGRFVFFPHGMDQMFWKANGPIMPGMKGLVAEAVIEIPECRRRYVKRVTQLLETVCRVDALTNRVDQLAAALGSAPAESGGFAGTMRRFFQGDPVADLKRRIVERSKSLDEQLRGIQTPLVFDANGMAPLSGWKSRRTSGRVEFNQTEGPASLQITAGDGRSAGAWWTTVWLEGGRYQVAGKVRVQNVAAGTKLARAGAGFRVFSRRKITTGLVWDWFPYRESRDLERRGELAPAAGTPNRRLSGTTDWIEVSYEFDLPQPIADLEISCELRADEGEAWFERDSLKILHK